jgi:hypothetical protein
MSSTGYCLPQLLLQELQLQKKEAIASYLEFTGKPVVSVEGDVSKIGPHLPSNGKLCLLFIAIIEFIIILGLLMFIYVTFL